VNEAGSTIQEGQIYAFRTSQGRIAKLEVTSISSWNYSKWYLFFGADFGRECKFNFRWVVFDSAAASIHAETSVLYDKDVSGIKLDGSSSKGTIWRWYVTQGPAGGGWTLDDDDLQIATLYPASKAMGGYEQTYEIELVIDSGQNPAERAKTTIEVFFPHAIIGAPDKTEFNPGDVLRASLPGGTSVGARTHDWSLVSAPAGSTDAKMEDAKAKTATLIPDVSGTYIVELTINKGDADEDKVQRSIVITIN